MSNLPSDEQDRIEKILHRVLRYAENEGYAGYSKFDALNSPLLKRLSLDNKWLRFLFTQAVMRSPWNFRKLLKVQKSINPKGMALFALAYLDAFERTQSEAMKERAIYCLSWLYENRASTGHGAGWGYNFDWQSTLFYAPRYTPNAIVTVLCGEAFVRAFEVLGEQQYRDAAAMAARFLRYDLPVLHESGDELCIGYVDCLVRSVVLNINASAGAQIAKTAHFLHDDSLRMDAKRMLTFVANRRTPYYAWYYTYPAKNSYIVHDNYHTGGIVDAIFDYERYTGDSSFHEIYEKGLAYYARELFLENGAPKYMNNAIYPFDIHGAAQGVISFSKAAQMDRSYLQQATQIAKWTLDNLFDEKQDFFCYQKGRFFTKRFTLMRWCNAWMTRALSYLLLTYKKFS